MILFADDVGYCRAHSNHTYGKYNICHGKIREKLREVDSFLSLKKKLYIIITMSDVILTLFQITLINDMLL